MARAAVVLLLLAGLCCVDSWSLRSPVAFRRRPVSSDRAALSPRARETARIVSFAPGESRAAPGTRDQQPGPAGVPRSTSRRFESRLTPETAFARPGAVKAAGSRTSRSGSRRSPSANRVRPGVSVIPGSRRGRRYGSGGRAPSPVRPGVSVIPGSRRGHRYGSGGRAPSPVRPGASVIPGSRRGQYGSRRDPATLHARRDAFTLPGSRLSVSSVPSFGRDAPSAVPRRPSSLSSLPPLPPLPPVYRNLCRQRRPATLSQLPAPLRSVCRDFWRRSRGQQAPTTLPAGQKYAGPAPLTARRRRHHVTPPAVAAGRPRSDADRFYRPYWPYKSNGQRYY